MEEAPLRRSGEEVQEGPFVQDLHAQLACLLELAARLLARDDEVGLPRHAARDLPPAALHLLLRLLPAERTEGPGEDHRLAGEWAPGGVLGRLGADPGGEERLDALAVPL